MGNKEDKIIVIPGWMDRSHYHCKWRDLNVWGEKVHLERKIEEEYIVGHCAGAPLALLLWKHNKNKKIILVNPLFPRRSFFEWARRFFRFSRNEPLLHPIARIPMIPRIVMGGFSKLLMATRVDSIEIINKIPRDDLVIVYGKEDNYFFDDDARSVARNMGIRMIQVEEAGHNWHAEFNDVIEGVVSAP